MTFLRDGFNDGVHRAELEVVDQHLQADDDTDCDEILQDERRQILLVLAADIAYHEVSIRQADQGDDEEGEEDHEGLLMPAHDAAEGEGDQQQEQEEVLSFKFGQTQYVPPIFLAEAYGLEDEPTEKGDQ